MGFFGDRRDRQAQHSCARSRSAASSNVPRIHRPQLDDAVYFARSRTRQLGIARADGPPRRRRALHLGAARGCGVGAIHVLVKTHPRVVRSFKYLAPPNVEYDKRALAPFSPARPPPTPTPTPTAPLPTMIPAPISTPFPAPLPTPYPPPQPSPYIPVVAPGDVAIKILQDNPKRPGGASYIRYESYKQATTKSLYHALGGSAADFRHDGSRGFVTVLPPLGVLISLRSRRRGATISLVRFRSPVSRSPPAALLSLSSVCVRRRNPSFPSSPRPLRGSAAASTRSTTSPSSPPR